MDKCASCGITINLKHCIGKMMMCGVCYEMFRFPNREYHTDENGNLIKKPFEFKLGVQLLHETKGCLFMLRKYQSCPKANVTPGVKNCSCIGEENICKEWKVPLNIWRVIPEKQTRQRNINNKGQLIDNEILE